MTDTEEKKVGRRFKLNDFGLFWALGLATQTGPDVWPHSCIQKIENCSGYGSLGGKEERIQIYFF